MAPADLAPAGCARPRGDACVRACSVPRVYLFLPNVVVVLFSFNKPNGRFNYTWTQFSLDAWQNPCGAAGHVRRADAQPEDRPARDVVATVLGTLIAFALVRHRFRGRGRDQPADLPADGHARGRDGRLAAHPVRQPRRASSGFWTILIAHVMFCLSFVVVTVKARLAAWTRGWSRPRWTCTPTSADVPADHPAAGRARHRRGRAAGVLAVLRRLHHHQLQLRHHGDLPDVRLGLRPARHPVADQRHRHGDVRRSPCCSCVAGQLVGEPAGGRAATLVRREPDTMAPVPCDCCPSARRRRAGPVLAGRPRHGPTPLPALAGAEHCRPGRRRRRLQRAVDRAARQGARPRPGRACWSRRHDRLGGLRPQRRLLRRQPDPRPRQRPGPLARRDRRAGAARARRTSTRIEATVERYGIDCDFERTGELDVATEPHQLDELREAHAEQARRYGHRTWGCSTATQVRAEVDSPTYLGGLLRPARRRHA